MEDFLTAKDLSKASQNTFRALLMAAVRKADVADIQKLLKAFPDLVAETIARGNSADGRLPTE